MKGEIYKNNINHFFDKLDIKKSIKFLKKRSKKNSSRLVFNKNNKSKLHFMLIRHLKSYIGDPFKFPNKKKIFLLIYGSANFQFFNNKGKLIKKILFNKNNSILFIDESKYFYNQKILTEELIFFEITNGPFQKNKKIFLKDINKNFRSLVSIK